MFILKATKYSLDMYYGYFSGNAIEIVKHKKHALKFNNLFEVKQLVNKYNISDYKIIEIKE